MQLMVEPAVYKVLMNCRASIIPPLFSCFLSFPFQLFRVFLFHVVTLVPSFFLFSTYLLAATNRSSATFQLIMSKMDLTYSGRTLR
jgi:hypothetical protein